MKGTYRIAGKNIGIRSVYPAVHELCNDYRTDAAEEFTVSISHSDIEYERRKNDHGGCAAAFSDSYLETLAVYRRIAEKMPEYDTVLFHGSAVAVDGEAYIFTAGSGTGKSTHTALWREMLGERAVMINDDKPLIRIEENRATVYGTPWDGKHRLSSNIARPLKAVCILERGEENRIRPVSWEEAFPEMLRRSYRSENAVIVEKTLRLLERLAAVSFYSLHCNMDMAAAKLSFGEMSGKQAHLSCSF